MLNNVQQNSEMTKKKTWEEMREETRGSGNSSSAQS